MNLSKIFPSEETFEPEEIVRTRVKEPAEFGPSLIPSAPQGQPFKEQDLPVEHQPSPEPNRIGQPPKRSKPEVAPQPPRQAGPDPPTPSPEPPPGQETPTRQETPPRQEPQPRKEHVARKEQPTQPPGIPQQEVDRLVAEAYEQGVAAGLEQAETDFGAAAGALLTGCQQLDSLRETVIQNSVGEIRELVIAIAERIIRRSLEKDGTTILPTVEEAIEQAIRSESFTIYVHQDDYQTIIEKVPDLVASINGLNNIVVKRDPKIERGGCLLESEYCTVDATISGQLELVRQELEQS